MAKTKSLYSVHPSVRYMQHVIKNMAKTTGRSIDEWITFVNKSGPKTELERRDWLKKAHKLGSNYAQWIAGRSVGKQADDADPDAYLREAEAFVARMFEGKRAALKPVYDRLLKVGLSLGNDVKACPCETIVPLFRKHVFVQIKPATNSRIDLGLCLRGQKPPKRLINTGGEAKGDRITHRFAIESIDDIDADVTRWMRKAYELASPE